MSGNTRHDSSLLCLKNTSFLFYYFPSPYLHPSLSMVVLKLSKVRSVHPWPHTHWVANTRSSSSPPHKCCKSGAFHALTSSNNCTYASACEKKKPERGRESLTTATSRLAVTMWMHVSYVLWAAGCDDFTWRVRLKRASDTHWQEQLWPWLTKTIQPKTQTWRTVVCSSVVM